MGVGSRYRSHTNATKIMLERTLHEYMQPPHCFTLTAADIDNMLAGMQCFIFNSALFLV